MKNLLKVFVLTIVALSMVAGVIAPPSVCGNGVVTGG